ncbi:MAG: hypothetical protein A2W93_12250 [Bacteroidetes bacterium GWF2_43_63]|nr:MAG: hypothetical protein A2W94_15740 [Bacteroidetes bacterium GWE2_42_42]OFY56390.1 MAG: hypothetical protein A2W93_12250 [Bacteroidetes bacterium GWF2_43_63]HBG69641.1 hypothetical protein [Bacteroidales bacterium]HCB61907.1 hypothetical protein [Bacteroidales bacterium]HCY22133.1 hypothetical protein [Bacteroidales bacterium]
MRKPATFLVFLFAVFCVSAQTDLKVSLSRDSIRIGELSQMQWQLSLPGGTKVLQMPMVADSMPSGIEVVKKKEIITEKKGKLEIYKQQLSVSAYDSGYFTIPALSAIIQQGDDTVEILSDSLLLYCTTIPVDTTKAVKDIKDIYEVDEKTSWKWLWYVIAGILIAVAGFFIYLRLRKKKSVIPAEEIVWINPAEAALAALRKMQESRAWFSVSPKDFYTELVEIIRKYLKYSRDIHAEEMLSSELINAVTKKELPVASIQNLKGILSVADMAKFARFRPEPGQYEKSVSNAIDFVSETRPVETNTDNNGMD